MSKNKLQKFAENRESLNVIEQQDPFFAAAKGNWHQHFGNDKPIVLELACGRGEYTVGLAREFPDKNFIGIDIKGARIWKGSQIAQQEGLTNVAFLRTLIHDLGDFFEDGEVSEIWITFPDPFPKKSDRRRRLTHERFLDLYKQVIKPLGTVHLKTDNTKLFEFSLESIKAYGVQNLEHTFNLYPSEFQDIHHGIQTYYERLWTAKGMDIKYLRFHF